MVLMVLVVVASGVGADDADGDSGPDGADCADSAGGDVCAGGYVCAYGADRLAGDGGGDGADTAYCAGGNYTLTQNDPKQRISSDTHGAGDRCPKKGHLSHPLCFGTVSYTHLTLPTKRIV